MPRRVASGSIRPAKASAPNVCVRERARGERPPPNLAPGPQGSGALFFLFSADREAGRKQSAEARVQRAKAEASKRRRTLLLAFGSRQAHVGPLFINSGPL